MSTLQIESPPDESKTLFAYGWNRKLAMRLEWPASTRIGSLMSSVRPPSGNFQSLISGSLELIFLLN